MKRLVCFVLCLLYWQLSSATSVKLVTIGPGDAFWSAFGHTAIAVDDAVYGFGYFSFDDDIIGSFVDNRMQYDLGVSDLQYEIRLAQQQNRDFSTIELNLTTAEIKQIADYLQWHMLPENQSYGYDYFLNNCSTKVRDILDSALNQRLGQYSQSMIEEKASNYIEQTFPAKNQGVMNFGLALGYGWPAYKKRNSWELMALPMYFESYFIRSFEQITEPRQLIFQADTENQIQGFILTHWFLISYVILWSVLLLYKRTQYLGAKIWFIGHGLIGVILLALWFLTPHTVASWNFNVLLFMPLGFFIFRSKLLQVVMLMSWVIWFVLAAYLKAWYLLPLLLPALMALKLLSKSHFKS